MELSQITTSAREELIKQGNSAEAIDAYIALGIGDDDLSNFEEAYSGEFENDEEFAQDMAENIGALAKEPQWPYTCIDWEFAARELMYDYSEENGYYFRNL